MGKDKVYISYTFVNTQSHVDMRLTHVQKESIDSPPIKSLTPGQLKITTESINWKSNEYLTRDNITAIINCTSLLTFKI